MGNQGEPVNRLLVGYKASELTTDLLQGEVVCHTLDIYHRHAIEKSHHVKAVCSPHLPEGEWDEIWFRTGPKLMSGELALDLMQECMNLVAKGSLPADRFHLDFVGRERERNELLEKVKTRTDRVFRAEWPASVPGGEKLLFTSYPGCFCHRRLDEGGLALAEIVCRELSSNTPQLPFKLLDMGCGCGLVGLLIADFARQRQLYDLHPVLVDSHSRAIEAARENAEKFGLAAEVILSDNGTPARMDGSFDVFVGNPPYYSDYRIADVFLETARRSLKPGGVCYSVCKNAAGLAPVQERYFPAVEIIKRRGYAVLKSIRSE